MAKLPLGVWAPDVAGVDSEEANAAINVLPQANGYGPVRGPNAVSGNLPGAAKGGVTVRQKSGAYMFFAGTASNLYRFNTVSLGWDVVSAPGASYFVPDDDYWSFAQFNNILIATHVNAPPQWIDIENGTTFADLTGSPPRARFVTTVGPFVVLGGLTDYPSRVQWSGIGNANFWTPGINYSDVQDFSDGGRVNGIAGGEFGVVFQERSIRRMVYSPGSPLIFQFSKVEDARGAVAPWNVVQVGPRIFFLDRDGFYLYTGGASQSIGANRINTWFAKNVDATFITKTVGIPDVKGSRIFWSFKSTDSSDPNLLDKVMVYDWQLDRWSLITGLPIRYFITAGTPSVSIDSLSGSLDNMMTSLDSAIFAGGVPTIGVFGTDNKLSFLEGNNLEATVETVDGMMARPRRAFVRGTRLDGDAPLFGVQIGGRESLGDPVTWNVEATPNVERFAPALASARYHRARIRIPAAQAWSFMSGVEVDAVPEGVR